MEGGQELESRMKIDFTKILLGRQALEASCCRAAGMELRFVALDKAIRLELLQLRARARGVSKAC